MPSTSPPRSNIAKALAVGSGLAFLATGVFVWLTSATDTFDNFAPPLQRRSQPTSNVVSPAPSVPLPLLPDHGEPRTQRLLQIETTVRALRSNQAPPTILAAALLSHAEICIQLNRLGLAQSALDEARRLTSAPPAWQVREAQVLEQTIRLRESGDAIIRQQLHDVAEYQCEALRHQSAGRYLDAVHAARQAVAIWRRAETALPAVTLDGFRDGEMSHCLLLLGKLVMEHSDTYSEAESLLSEARERGQPTWGDSHPIFAEILTTLARLQENRGDFEGAEKLYNQALDIQRAVGGELSLEFARTLAGQGRMHLDWWEEYGAGKGYRALQIREQLLGLNHLECADSLEHLGMNAVWLLNFDKAEQLLQRALKIREREQGQNHPDLAESLNWLSQVHLYRGDVALAALTLGRAIELTKSARGKMHPHLLRYLPNVARIGRYDWNPTRGEREGRLALEIATSRGMVHHPIALDARSAIADLMQEEESPYGIAQLIRRDPRYIAEFSRESIRLHAATTRHQQLPSFAAAKIQLANTGYWDDYQSVSRADATRLLEEARDNINRHGQDLHPLFSEYLLVRGRWHLWESDHALASQLLQQSLKVIEQRYGVTDSEVIAGAWRSLAGVSMHAGLKTPESCERLRTSARLDEQIFQRNATGQCDIDRFSMARARFFSLGCSVMSEVGESDDAERYRHVLLAKGETSQLQYNELLFHALPEFSAAFAHVREARQHMKTVAFDIPTDAKLYPTWREAMFAAADRKEMRERELAIQLRGRFPTPPATNPKQVQEHLPARTAFIDFLQFTDLTPPPGGHGRLHRTRTISAFVSRSNRPIQSIRLGTSQEIETAITEWLKAIQDHEATLATLQDHASRVAKLIMDPLKSAVEGCDELLIAPDGPICFIPFAALPGKLSGTYLIEDFTIGYVPSARQWVELQDRKDASGLNRLLAVGDINYQTPTHIVARHAGPGRRGLLPDDVHWNNLPATRAEAEQVEELYSQVMESNAARQLLSGRTLTVAELDAALRQRPRYFHFAGHGLFADWHAPPHESRPVTFDNNESSYATNSESIVLGRAPLLLSGLVLSSPPGSLHPADAIMTAEDVSNLDLRGTELVVLSACETGLGKTAGGEGTMGLQRAFLNAGARSVMASLWKVDDAATSLLMERFYHRLWSDKMSKWQALRQAQLDLLQHPEQLRDRESLLVSRGVIAGRTKTLATSTATDDQTVTRTHPALWGAFVLHGDGR